MELFLQILLLIGGFVLLIWGADIFVDGASAVARIFKISAAIIGVTIVSMGTSLPELAVSTSAALSGANQLALSNVIGSNFFNMLVVLGLTAVFARKSVPVADSMLKVEFPLNLIVTMLLLCFSGDLLFKTGIDGLFSSANKTMETGAVNRYEGIGLLVIFACYIAYTVVQAKKEHSENKTDEKVSSKKVVIAIVKIIAGAAMIKFGGDFVVDSASYIAGALGMSQTLIGLTIVACGTSLPELATSIVAARKNEIDLAVGNVIGSNLFNILFILGVSTTIHPIAVYGESVYDLLLLLVAGFLTSIFCMSGRKVNKAEGAVMVLIYAEYLTYIILR